MDSYHESWYNNDIMERLAKNQIANSFDFEDFNTQHSKTTLTIF